VKLQAKLGVQLRAELDHSFFQWSWDEASSQALK